MFMPADRSNAGEADLFGKMALGHLCVDGGAGQARHALDFLEPYNSASHRFFLFLCKADPW